MRSSAARCTLVLSTALLLMSARSLAADRQIRPFVGATFGGATTFVDPQGASGRAKPAIGVGAVFLGELFGGEIDIFDGPGFFGTGNDLVKSSRVTAFTGNVIVAAPHRVTEYSLRPYLVGGVGLMQVRRTTLFNVFDISTVLPTVDIGVGAVAFVTNRVGVSWDVRRFQSVGANPPSGGLTFGEQHLSFWRAAMAAVIRY
ncbi:MAG: hypothetical protein JWL71_1547 [Acidobacteria bacterium]|nr:hypothetical protein [Acidobacteriota bacterium]